MKAKIKELISEVRVALDENREMNALLASDANTLELDDIIQQKLQEALRMVYQQASERDLMEVSVTLLGGGVAWEKEKQANGLWMVRVEEPADYLKLLAVKLDDWVAPVNRVTEDGSDAHRQAKSRWAGVAGNPERPVVVETIHEGKNVLELYASEHENQEKAWGSYVPEPAVEGESVETEVKISTRLYYAVIYQAAGLTALTQGENDFAQSLLAIAKRYVDSNEEAERTVKE